MRKAPLKEADNKQLSKPREQATTSAWWTSDTANLRAYSEPPHRPPLQRNKWSHNCPHMNYKYPTHCRVLKSLAGVAFPLCCACGLFLTHFGVADDLKHRQTSHVNLQMQFIKQTYVHLCVKRLVCVCIRICAYTYTHTYLYISLLYI